MNLLVIILVAILVIIFFNQYTEHFGSDSNFHSCFLYGNDYDMKDTILNHYLEDRLYKDRMFWVMKLGKLNDFVKIDWREDK